tara:strand:+ start:83250 stop:84395 length:1146 start_codon:yes stop_codon:yes gene_type:complete
MNIGILKENKYNRVLISPFTAKNYIDNGHNVYFSKDCGLKSGFTNKDYINAGCKLKEDNIEIIKDCDLLISFNLPRKSEIEMIKNKTILSRSEPISNLEKIEILSENKNTLIDIEYLKRENEYYISNKIDNIIADIAFNIIYYKYSKSGYVLNNFDYLPRKKVSIIGYNHLSKELLSFFDKIGVNIAIYKENNNLTDIKTNKYEVLSITEIDRITDSDVIINTTREKQKPNTFKLPDEIFHKLKENCFFMDLSINNGKISKFFRETNFDDIIFKYDKKYISCPQDITCYSGKTLSHYISSHLIHYINLIIDGFENSDLFLDSYIIKDGKINNDFSFIEEEEIKEIIHDPFDIIENDFEFFNEDNEKLDKLNEKLNELNDYE